MVQQNQEHNMPPGKDLLSMQFEFSPDIIFFVDQNLKILKINHVAHGTPFTVQAAVGKDAIDILPENTRQPVKQEMLACFATGEVRELDHEIWDGQWLHTRMVPVKLKGIVENLLVISGDITERRRAEYVMREGETHCKFLFDNMINGLAYCRMIYEEGKPYDFIYLDVNSAFEKLTGLKGVIGKKVTEVIPGIREKDLQLFEIYGRVARTGMQERFELHLNSLDMWFDVAVYSPQKDHFVAVFDVITEHKRAESALRASEEKYLQLAESSLDYLFVISRDDTVLYMNDASAKLFGKPPGEIIGRRLKELFPGFIYEQMHGNLQKVFESGREILVENAYPFPSGSVWLSVRLTPVRDKDNKITAVQGITRDITERVKAEEAAVKSREEYQKLVENINDVIYSMNKDGVITYVNRVITDITGYAPEEIVGKHFSTFIHKDDISRVFAELEDLYKHNKLYPSEYRLITKSGEARWVRSSSRPVMEDGGVTGFTGVLADIDKEKRTEEELSLSRKRIQAVFEQSIFSIVVVDMKKRTFIEFNRQAHESLGYTREEFSRLSLADIAAVGSPEEITRQMEKIAADGFYVFEIKHRKKNGEMMDVLVDVRVIPFENEKMQIAIWQDITEKKRAEADRMRMEKSELMRILAGGIAHDFNNMLTHIIGNINLAKAKVGASHEIYPLLRDAEKGGMSAASLTQMLLTFTKDDTAEKECLRIDELVKSSTEFALQGTNCGSEFSIPEGLWFVEANAAQLGRVIDNIVINARQAMPDGGAVRIAIENAAIERKNAFGLAEGDYVHISVQDSGSGIDSAMLNRMFDPYFTTKKNGSGLGLASAYSIIKKHNGSICVESEISKGSTFHIYLPASGKAPTRQKVAEILEQRPGVGNILVMDDEEGVRAVIGRMLGTIGFKAVFARNGEETIALYKDSLRSGNLFDALLLDLTVKGGMGGKKAFEELVKIDPGVKVIATSGYSDDTTFAEYKNMGFKDFVGKPFSIEQLSTVLSKALNSEK